MCLMITFLILQSLNYKKKFHLNILQYNVRNDKTVNMIFLFCDSRTRQFDILAIQES